jgi:heterodisulfide reductase subunit A-like polyferredoxin
MMTDVKERKQVCGAVLVVGAGISGIQASLDLSAAGYRVYLIEENPAVGGRMARLDKTFPTGDCATCIISPKLVECMRDLNIEVMTMTDVVKIDGEAGNFTATLRRRPRYVDVAKCTGCGDCAKVCPVEIPSGFDEGIGTRKAIDKLYAQAAPNAVFITKKHRAPCSSGCPIDTSVQAYVALISRGKFKEAADVIRRDNPLPSICGRVCFHPCEAKCNRGQIDEPVSICALKRFAMEHHAPQDPATPQPTGKKVAVVGSGPAGLAAAHSLVQKGHAVTVYESLPKPGGMTRYGIPAFRLPVDVLDRDIEAIQSLGVSFKTGVTIGIDLTLEELRKSNDAVFVATGAHTSLRLGIPGEALANVIPGVDFLRSAALGKPVRLGEKTVVVGGGNVAVDSARTALRAGSAKVTVVYRRSRREMPASHEEVKLLEEEGVELLFQANPVKVLSENGTLEAVECVRMELGEPDAKGRRKAFPVEGSRFVIPCDTLITAIGQKPGLSVLEKSDMAVTDIGTIRADPLSLCAGSDGVFAGGDSVLGPASVIEAINHGKRAGTAIDNFLCGRPLGEGITLAEARPNPLSKEDIDRKKSLLKPARRAEPRKIGMDKRLGGFEEVEHTLTEKEAVREASRCLNCADCCECRLCVEACKAGAIIHEDGEKTVTVDVGAVLLAPGFSAFDPLERLEYGTGYSDNILTNLQFERMLSAAGPTEGKIRRLSDGGAVKRLAFVQCVGSRDSKCGNQYCSSVCCMATTKEAILAKEHEPGIEVTVFFMDLRAFGKDFDRYCERARKLGVAYVRCRPSTVEEIPGSKNLRIGYLDGDNTYVCDEFDMVVLSLGLEPSARLSEQAGNIGIRLNQWGFALTADASPLETSRPGVFVGGAFQEPKDIPETVMQASGAAAKAMALLAPARGSLIRKKSYPPERDVTDEPPRIGVFICHCGSNIASVVDVEKVAEYAATLPDVVFADHAIYVCADDGQALIKQKIKEYGLNRLVIASCTPRTHEPIFRDTLREAGLNQYLLEMANIRDQCSWVHSGDPDAATKKAMDLVRMIVGRARKLLPLRDETVPVTNAALVIGGGIAGMTAALSLSEQGFPVHLVEKEARLGGDAAKVNHTLGGLEVGGFLSELEARISRSGNVSVHLRSTVSKIDGHIGGFESIINKDGKEGEQVRHGVVIIATGAEEKKPSTMGYGSSGKVLTQLELSERLGGGDGGLRKNGSVVMIQCVEQRNDERTYCSRVCCATAVKNALDLKERHPGLSVTVLYRDIRTYGFLESKYQEARSKGVLFVRYDENDPPQVEAGETLSVSFSEPVTGVPMRMEPDMIVLSAPMVPRAGCAELSELLRLPLNQDGFFLEAHVKLRPVDFASEGIFLCGTAHAPKFITETISQAHAAAARAAGILSKKALPVSGQTAWVDQDKCISCMTCMHVCPYNAPGVNLDNKAEIQGGACMGCGSCASECPAMAITLRNYTETQIGHALDTLFGGGRNGGQAERRFPEQAGIAPLRIRRG